MWRVYTEINRNIRDALVLPSDTVCFVLNLFPNSVKIGEHATLEVQEFCILYRSNIQPRLITGTTIRERVHLVTRVHFRSHDKDGGYTIRSATVENTTLHANFMALCFTERGLPGTADQSFTLWEQQFFLTFLAPVTFTLTR